MLSKPAALLLGMIYEHPRNAYEITKLLHDMNIKWWFQISDSTVYTTLKNLGKKGFVTGSVEKTGNMPDKTIYALTEKGTHALRETVRQSILQFNYDTNIFTIAAFLMDILEREEQKHLLEERLRLLHAYQNGIRKQDTEAWERQVPASHAANLKRMADIVQAEISGTERLLAACGEGKKNES